ncbi:MAG: hypothetical protein JRC60_00330 [Deltaproteobacteria bacterium]|nr:hypothetical protein [Deltaproteobacteria bacterium]
MKFVGFKVLDEEFEHMRIEARKGHKTMSAYVRDMICRGGRLDRLEERVIRIEQNLNRIYFAAERSNIAIEELTRWSVKDFKKYLANIEQRMQKIKRGEENKS